MPVGVEGESDGAIENAHVVHNDCVINECCSPPSFRAQLSACAKMRFANIDENCMSFVKKSAKLPLSEPIL